MPGPLASRNRATVWSALLGSSSSRVTGPRCRNNSLRRPPSTSSSAPRVAPKERSSSVATGSASRTANATCARRSTVPPSADGLTVLLRRPLRRPRGSCPAWRLVGAEHAAHGIAHLAQRGALFQRLEDRRHELVGAAGG